MGAEAVASKSSYLQVGVTEGPMRLPEPLLGYHKDTQLFPFISYVIVISNFPLDDLS